MNVMCCFKERERYRQYWKSRSIPLESPNSPKISDRIPEDRLFGYRKNSEMGQGFRLRLMLYAFMGSLRNQLDLWLL